MPLLHEQSVNHVHLKDNRHRCHAKPLQVQWGVWKMENAIQAHVQNTLCRVMYDFFSGNLSQIRFYLHEMLSLT